MLVGKKKKNKVILTSENFLAPAKSLHKLSLYFV